MMWLLLWILQPATALVAIGAPAGAISVDEGTAAGATVQSVWDFIVKGGPVMIPIGLCSLVAVTVLVERLIALRRPRITPPALRKEISATRSTDRLQRTAENDGSPLGRLVTIGCTVSGRPVDEVERRLREAGEREVIGLRKRLRVLSVIAAVAPLLGLLGTIFGMIEAFQTVAVSGEALGKTEMLAGGIYEAMITTAAGLIVAIPVLIFYHWISAVVDQRALDLDEAVSALRDRLIGAPATTDQPAPDAETEMASARIAAVAS